MSKDNIFVIVIAFFATIVGLLFGFDTGVISGALQFISKTFFITNSHVGLKEIIVSSVPIGALVGASLSNISSSLYIS
jgi:MFS transporter, SP family, galactose:H+ symporter